MFIKHIREGRVPGWWISGVVLALAILSGPALAAPAAIAPQPTYELEYGIIGVGGGWQSSSNYDVLFSLESEGPAVARHTSADYTVTSVLDFADTNEGVFWYLH